jgi:hypothetical protein
MIDRARRRAALLILTALIVAGLVLVPSSTAVAKTYCTGVLPGPTVAGSVIAGPGCDLENLAVTGSVDLSRDGSLTANGVHIHGSLTIAHTSQDSSVCGSTVDRVVTIRGNSGDVSFGGGGCGSPSSAGRDVQIQQNTGSVDLNGDVGRNLTVDTNATSGPVDLVGGEVGHDLDCRDNTPDPNPGSMTVDGATRGPQCRSKTVTQCPEDGCSTTIDSASGDASADVTVPGGGDAGKVTLSFDPPPPDDGCFGEGSQPVGSVLTVGLPAGYTADNPVELDISWSDGEKPIYVDAVCKSVDGQPPYTPVPPCSPPPAPDRSGIPEGNAPCFQTNEGGGITLYLDSNDPVISGH